MRLFKRVVSWGVIFAVVWTIPGFGAYQALAQKVAASRSVGNVMDVGGVVTVPIQVQTASQLNLGRGFLPLIEMKPISPIAAGVVPRLRALPALYTLQNMAHLLMKQNPSAEPSREGGVLAVGDIFDGKKAVPAESGSVSASVPIAVPDAIWDYIPVAVGGSRTHGPIDMEGRQKRWRVDIVYHRDPGKKSGAQSFSMERRMTVSELQALQKRLGDIKGTEGFQDATRAALEEQTRYESKIPPPWTQGHSFSEMEILTVESVGGVRVLEGRVKNMPVRLVFYGDVPDFAPKMVVRRFLAPQELGSLEIAIDRKVSSMQDSPQKSLFERVLLALRNRGVSPAAPTPSSPVPQVLSQRHRDGDAMLAWMSTAAVLLMALLPHWDTLALFSTAWRILFGSVFLAIAGSLTGLNMGTALDAQRITEAPGATKSLGITGLVLGGFFGAFLAAHSVLPAAFVGLVLGLNVGSLVAILTRGAAIGSGRYILFGAAIGLVMGIIW